MAKHVNDQSVSKQLVSCFSQSALGMIPVHLVTNAEVSTSEHVVVICLPFIHDLLLVQMLG